MHLFDRLQRECQSQVDLSPVCIWKSVGRTHKQVWLVSAVASLCDTNPSVVFPPAKLCSISTPFLWLSPDCPATAYGREELEKSDLRLYRQKRTLAGPRGAGHELYFSRFVGIHEGSRSGWAFPSNEQCLHMSLWFLLSFLVPVCMHLTARQSSNYPSQLIRTHRLAGRKKSPHLFSFDGIQYLKQNMPGTAVSLYSLLRTSWETESNACLPPTKEAVGMDEEGPEGKLVIVFLEAVGKAPVFLRRRIESPQGLGLLRCLIGFWEALGEIKHAL